MYPHALIDLHCDTLTACLDEEFRRFYHAGTFQGDLRALLMDRVKGRDTLDLPGSHFALSQIPPEVHWCQCCAIFVPDGLSQEERIAYYELFQRSFLRQAEGFAGLAQACRSMEEVEAAWAAGKHALILTVESGSALAGDLDRVEVLARDGVRMLTLTWNGANELASGSATDNGLSPFGRDALSAMEELGILADVSHLNDRSFWDVAEAAKKPFVASHSNARSVCGHLRNLTDDQIRAMVERRCLIGLNYSVHFLQDGGGGVQPEQLCRHLDRFLELGAEDCLALGSDADGTDVPPWLNCTDKLAGLYGLLLEQGYPAGLLDRLFWKNAQAFFRANLISA